MDTEMNNYKLTSGLGAGMIAFINQISLSSATEVINLIVAVLSLGWIVYQIYWGLSRRVRIDSELPTLISEETKENEKEQKSEK